MFSIIRLTLLWSIVLTPACSLFGPKLKGAPATAIYDRPNRPDQCRGLPYTVTPSTDVASKVWKVMCGGKFDDFRRQLGGAPFDDVNAAVAVSTCAAHCPDQGDLAAAYDMASRINDVALRDAVEAAELPAFVVADFLDRFAAARVAIRDAVKAAGPRFRAVMIKPAQKARAERAGDDAALADLRGEFAELSVDIDRARVDHDAPDELVARAVEFRSRYVAQCKDIRDDAAHCLADDVMRPLVYMLIDLATERSDHALARAEASLLNLPDRSKPEHDVYLALEAAISEERAAHREYTDAVAKGIDADVLAERFPEVPLDVSRARIRIGVAPGRANSVVRSTNETTFVSEQVRKVVRRGDRATIYFRRDTYTYKAETGCRETSKVDYIADNGEIVYRQVCTGPTVTRTHDRTTTPIVVPWAEASKVERHDVVHAVVTYETREGYITSVAQGDKDTPATVARRYSDWEPIYKQFRGVRL